jgi:hypothetical protein
MTDEPLSRKAMRVAERGERSDPSRLVARVPDMLREVRRRRERPAGAFPAFVQLAHAMLPRFAAATFVAVLAATTYVVWERKTAATATAFESAVLGADGDGTGDAAFDDLLDLEGNDG